MKTLRIEWRHYAKGGATCDRCAATGKSVQTVVAALSQDLAAQGIEVCFSEVVLPKERMAESNMILFNDVPLEEILANASSGESDCSSCACLSGNATSCRTVTVAGVSHEEIPAALIRKGALLALGFATFPESAC